MFNFPSPYPKEEKDKKTQRTLEIIPGILTWATLIGMPIFSFFLPVWVSVFIIIFDIYWIHRTIFISTYSVSAYRKLVRGKNTDWWRRCQNIGNPENYIKILKDKIEDLKRVLKEDMSFFEKRKIRKEMRLLKLECKEVSKLIGKESEIWDWRKVIHVVMLPTAGEPASVIEPTINP